MLGGLFSLALLFVTISEQNLVDDLGHQWVSVYRRSYFSQARDAMIELHSGRINLVANLLDEADWRSIRLGDRAYPFKRQMFAGLCAALLGQEKYAELLRRAGEWRLLDGRDFDALAFWYEALYRSTDRQEEALEGLAENWRRLPDSHLLRRFYAQALFDSGQKAKAVEISRSFRAERIERATKGWRLHWKWKLRHALFLPFEELKLHLSEIRLVPAWENLRAIWQVLMQWKNNKSLKKKGSVALNAFPSRDNTIYFQADIPRNMSTVQIDLPSLTNIKLEKFKLTIDGIAQDLSLVVFDYSGLVSENDWIKTSVQEEPKLIINILGLDSSNAEPIMTLGISFQVLIIDLLDQEELLSYSLATLHKTKSKNMQ